MNRRGVLPWLLVAAALVLLVVLGGKPNDNGPPLDPTSTGPDGTKAFFELVPELGGTIHRTSRPGADADVAVFLADHDDVGQQAQLRQWVIDGGTLIVADPRSPLGSKIDDLGVFGGVIESSITQGPCDVAALAGVTRVDPGTGLSYHVEPADQSCFGDEKSAFVVVSDHGAGHVVSIGGAGVFTNDLINNDDNELLVANLAVPAAGTNVAYVERPPVAPGEGKKQLIDLVPTNVKQAIIQLLIAFVLYALFRAIRLGAPVAEPQPVQIEGSELTRAIGSLLQRSHDPARSARLASDHAVALLSRRLGLGRGLPPDALAASLAVRTGLDPAALSPLFHPQSVQTDDDLVQHLHDLDQLVQEVLRDDPVTANRA